MHHRILVLKLQLFLHEISKDAFQFYVTVTNVFLLCTNTFPTHTHTHTHTTHHTHTHTGSPNHRITLSKVARLKKKGNKSDNPPPVLPYKPKETLSRSITMATTLQHNPLKMSQSIPVGVGTTTLPPTRSTRPLTPTQLAGNSCKNNNFDNDVISPIPPSESEGQGVCVCVYALVCGCMRGCDVCAWVGV